MKMFNLTSISKEDAFRICQLELNKAGIYAIYNDEDDYITGKQFDVTGVLYFADEDVTVTFVRRCFDWLVQSSQSIPFFPSDQSYRSRSTDNWEGLEAIVFELCQYFGEPVDLGSRYGRCPVLDALSPAEEIAALIDLASGYAEEKSDWHKNCCRVLLLDAISKAEGAQLEEPMAEAVFVLLKLHIRWADAWETDNLYGIYAHGYEVETGRYHQLNQLNHRLQAQQLAVFCQKNRALIETGLSDVPRKLKSFRQVMTTYDSDESYIANRRKIHKELHKAAASVQEVIKSEINLQHIVRYTLILYRIYVELGNYTISDEPGDCRLARTFMLLAKTINDTLPIADRLDENFPEAKEWNCFPKGSLAYLLHTSTIFSSPRL